MSEFLSTARGVAWRGLHVTYTNPAFVAPSIIFPLFFYVAFAGGLSSVGDVPGFSYPAGYDTFQFAFVLLQAAAFGGVFSGFGIAADFEQGFGRRLLLASPRRGAIVVGYALVALGRAVVTGSVLTIVALAFGMRPTGSLADYLALALLAAIVCLAAALFACGVAMRLKTIQAGPAMQMPVFLTLFLAPVFVPLELVGGWVHGVATSTRSPPCWTAPATCWPAATSACCSPSASRPAWPCCSRYGLRVACALRSARAASGCSPVIALRSSTRLRAAPEPAEPAPRSDARRDGCDVEPVRGARTSHSCPPERRGLTFRPVATVRRPPIRPNAKDRETTAPG